MRAGKEHMQRPWGVRVRGRPWLLPVCMTLGEDAGRAAPGGVSKGDTGEWAPLWPRLQRPCTQMSLSRCPALTGHQECKKGRALGGAFKLSTKSHVHLVLVQLDQEWELVCRHLSGGLLHGSVVSLSVSAQVSS